MGVAQLDALGTEISNIANRVANSRRYFESDGSPVHIDARFDSGTGTLIMSMDERFGPISAYAEMESLQSDVKSAVWPLLDGIPSFQGIDWKYGSRDMYFWFPAEKIDERDMRQFPGGGDGNIGSVLISAGHGYYYNHTYSDWRFQREPSNGILEDEITLKFSSALIGWMYMQGAAYHLARNVPYPGNHVPSGKPMQLMSARYLLEINHPDHPEIWHSLPDATHGMREYDEDIRSRPLYANQLGVDAIVSLHTNASDSPGVRGAKAIVQPGNPRSRALASMMLCYMNEFIHATAGYEDYPVRLTPSFENKGENRLALMPAVIVEMGFHTNSEDARALKDPFFQSASMRGVAKGYRLFTEGETCEPLALKAPFAISGVVGSVAKAKVNWLGHPEFPLRVSASSPHCRMRGDCFDVWQTIPADNEDKQFPIGYRCLEEDVERSPFALTLIAEDLAKVRTDPVVISVSCWPEDPGSEGPIDGSE